MPTRTGPIPGACSSSRARPSPVRGPAVFALLGACLCAGSVASRATHASVPDSVAVHFEIGTTTEVSNEQFYESAIDDTTFLGRRLHATPETRVAAVARAEWIRASPDRRLEWSLSPNASIGDKAVRLATTGLLRARPSEQVRYSLEPRFEYQRDESFESNRRDWRASVLGRFRRASLDESSALRLVAGSELVRVADGSDAFLLSGTSARAAIGYSHTPLFGTEWDMEYGAIVRGFRDSTSRDHAEHRFDLTLRDAYGGGHTLAFEAGGDRRVALRDPSNSRDRFVQLRARAEAGLQLGEEWSLRPSIDLEALRYDEPDSLVDFDYRLLGARLETRREIGPAWRISTGPRADWLEAPWSREEEYVDFAWGFEVEHLTAGSWWSITPGLGHREYSTEPAGPASIDSAAFSPHSSFDYLELTGYLDQALPARLRLRALGTLRAERHSDRDQDSRSLYFSVDVRRLF